MAMKYQPYGAGIANNDVKQPKFELPEGYASEADFLHEMRDMFYDDLQSDRLNREAALEDLRFGVGDQWDDVTRARREAARKPVLTVNRLPAFVAQILGSRMLNETDAKVAADNDAYQGVAQVRESLIRSIQKNSDADTAYDTALAGAVMCGIGNFALNLELNDDEAGDEQDLKIDSIPDHLSVVWDRSSKEPTGKDATRCFVVETISQQDFYQNWPWAQPSDLSIDINLRGDLRMTGWVSITDVRIAEYWRMRRRKRTLAQLIDGSTVDITNTDDPITLLKIAQRKDGSPIVREVNKLYAQRYLVSGMNILEGPYDLPLSRVPIYRVPGWEVQVGEWKHRWGLIRFLKDPQRLHNYWRSVVAERLMQTPRGVWTARAGAVRGRENEWRQSHLSDDPLLIYNDDTAEAPVRVQPAQMEDALLGQADMSAQDIKDVSNIHEANLGMPSNEVSQVAIMARQRVSDTGTIIYHKNLSKAIAEVARSCNELIPIAYDTARVVKIMGADGQENQQLINQFDDPRSIDITTGKFTITCSVGPSYATKRLEQSANMLGMAQAMPNILSVAADLIVAGQDWPDAQKIAARLRNAMPPNILSPNELTPQQQQAMQQGQQKQQAVESVQAAQATAEYLKTNSDAMLNAARARNFSAEADNQPLKMNELALKTAGELTHQEYQDRLDALRIAQGK